MAPTPKLSVTAVVESATRVVDTAGFDQLTVSAVALDLGVAPSALYTYCKSLDGLLNLVAIGSTEHLAAILRSAAIGSAGADALQAMGMAYRQFTLDFPGQFASTLRPPDAHNDDLAKANAAVLEVFVLVFAAMGLAQSRSHLAARSTQSALHGFLAMEHVAGTTSEHAAEYQHLIDVLQRGLR